MHLENPLTFVRSLKGAPASVLLALLLCRRPMTNQELQRWTAYSSASISRAVQLLVDLGWVSALGPHGPWTMSTGRQLPLSAVSNSEIAPASAIVEGQDLLMDQTEETERAQQPEDREDENVVKTLHTLYDLGIREPTAGRLARLPHVNPAYVTAHVEQANARGYQLGAAIHAIEQAWPLPVDPPVLTVEDRIRKFLSDRPSKHRPHFRGP